MVKMGPFNFTVWQSHKKLLWSIFFPKHKKEKCAGRRPPATLWLCIVAALSVPRQKVKEFNYLGLGSFHKLSGWRLSNKRP